MYALVFALALALAGCSKDTPTSPAPKVNPGSDDITSPPGLFPDPGELPVQGLNTVGGPDKYDIASEVLWGSILGTEKKDVALVRALDGIRVLISGVVEVDGKEQLYLGIDRADFAKHDIDNLRAVLETRFPSILIYIEASDGVDLLTGNEADEDIPVDVFSDDFGGGLGEWTSSSEWTVKPFDAYPVPDEATGNRVATVRSTDCTGACTLTTKPMDLSGYSSVTLSLHRWLDDALDAGDTFVVEVGNDGVYRTVGSWGSDDGDDVWHYNTFTLDQQHLGEQTTVRITVTMSSLSDLFSLFGGGEKTEERVVAVDNVLIQGMETANLVVHNVSVSPQSVNSGASVEVRYSVKNAGTADASKGNVSVYRHLSKTDNPATGGTQVSTFAMQSPLAPGAGFSRAANVKAPSVSEDTVIYYYACVDAADGEEQTDDNCGDRVTVTVKVKDAETPEPDTPAEEPEETPAETPAEEPDETVTETPIAVCEEPSWAENWELIASRKTAMAGDYITLAPAGTATTYAGTIGLGGVETTTGVRGFVTDAHNVVPHLELSAMLSHDDRTVAGMVKINPKIGFVLKKLLGKTYALPEVSETENGRYRIDGDVALVAYPWRPSDSCMQTWEGEVGSFCVKGNPGDDQIETVVPLTIRGKCGDTYEVVGSESPKDDLDLWMSGGVSGVHDKMRIDSADKMLITRGRRGIDLFLYVLQSETEPLGGDSGSPIYTIPDANDKVSIVGLIYGSGVLPGNNFTTAWFTSWEDAEKILDLKALE